MAAHIATHHETQTFLKVIYKNFYKVYETPTSFYSWMIYVLVTADGIGVY